MKRIFVPVFTFSALLVGVCALMIRADTVDVANEPSPVAEGIQTPAPPLSADYYPCTTCHEKGKTNNLRRQLKEDHTDIVFDHDSQNRWCLDCHAPLDRDKLHLASGELIDFNQSYRLCGQCHGTNYRDWKVGIHGKRAGMWNGQKSYLLCVHCHDPHSPAIKPINPFPSPVGPVGKPFLFGVKSKQP